MKAFWMLGCPHNEIVVHDPTGLAGIEQHLVPFRAAILLTIRSRRAARIMNATTASLDWLHRAYDTNYREHFQCGIFPDRFRTTAESRHLPGSAQSEAGTSGTHGRRNSGKSV